MKSFKLYNPDFNLDFKKVLEFFKKVFSGIFKLIVNFFKGFGKLIKKPIVAIILISLISGFVGGFIGRTSMNFNNQPGTFLGIRLASNNVEKNIVKTPKTIPEVVKEVSPAVVSVIVSQYVPILEQEYYNPFGDNSPFNIQIPRMVEKGKELKEVGGGSGFIISNDGLIVTNKHVVIETDAQYTVLMNDGNKYPATVLSRDPIQDVAVLKINATNLPTVILGNSDDMEIGQTVIAIGNALGEFRNTVSAGIVSGLMRSVTAGGGGGFSEQLEELIQTDAAINPGNSGGPLLNLYGEVIGIDTAVAQNAENIGFAIPVNKIKKDVNDVKTKGKIVYPFLGVRYVLINQTIKESNNLSVDYGALIQRGSNSGEPAIMPGSPAEKAGLQANDIILEINNQKINEQNSLSKLLLQYSPNQEIALKILRKDKEQIIKTTLEEWK
jgi:serine protease Do